MALKQFLSEKGGEYNSVTKMGLFCFNCNLKWTYKHIYLSDVRFFLNIFSGFDK